MEATKTSVFGILNSINCNEHTEKKNGLTYLSWAWAWAEIKKAFPDSFYTIYERENGIPYFTDGKTCWVKTGVTINGLEHIEYLPIMDYRNNSIPLDKVTSMDMNKTIQRSLTKACARHGLGLYIYAGEDLPEEEQSAKVDALANVIAEINESTSVEQLSTIYSKYPDMQVDTAFMSALSTKKKQLKDGKAKAK